MFNMHMWTVYTVMYTIGGIISILVNYQIQYAKNLLCKRIKAKKMIQATMSGFCYWILRFFSTPRPETLISYK